MHPSPTGGSATEDGTILAPIRYPLTARSARTIERAGQLARESAAQLLVLHVNVFQRGETATPEEIAQAIAPILEGAPADVVVRSGFLVEEIILDEASRSRADLVVIGKNRRPAWRRFISRLLGNDPAIEEYLGVNGRMTVEVVE